KRHVAMISDAPDMIPLRQAKEAHRAAIHQQDVWVRIRQAAAAETQPIGWVRCLDRYLARNDFIISRLKGSSSSASGNTTGAQQSHAA
ncbi:hypothetical protein MMC07_001882, partial [Pseudocyphellaria aurata]|nr:hypothetical protein [Pseudocyphellaria aurata]